MFKDYKKYLSTTVNVYIFVLFFIFILKLVGLDYFGLDINNPIMKRLEGLFSNLYVRDVFYFVFLLIYQYLMISVIMEDNSRKMKFYVASFAIVTYFVQLAKGYFMNNPLIGFSIELLYMFLIVTIYNQKVTRKYKIKKLYIRTSIVLLLNMLFEFISMITRYNYKEYIDSFIPNVLLTLDYFLLLLITQNIVVKKGDVDSCIYQEQVGSSSRKKINLKKSLQKLQKNYQSNLKKFKKRSKEEKLTIVIYLILSLIWNTMTVVLVLFVAFLNDTLIECIFILTSFWLSKSAFGPAFHFDSMLKCFIVSNLSYYILNRITTRLEISILVPILLGVGLSYFTSKFVKSKTKKLYRGMPENLFNETITKVVDKNSIKYKICYEFYIGKVSEVSLSFKYNYTVSGIRKIKERINKQLKDL